MAIRLYNSLTRKVEEFSPREQGQVHMFVCGPTVYDRVHLGNARTFTVFDVIAKWLRARGLEVEYIQNITDIDDKIIKRAAEQNRDPLEYAHEFDEKFREDMAALGNDAVSQFAPATNHIPQVISQVKKLIAAGNAYLIEGDGWYFDLSTFPDYGKLSGRTGLQADDAVSRIDDSEKKRNTGDFALWKLSKPGEPSWKDDELGEGRPGWHIEDTAITEHYFGPQYDLHGGGMDLKFPHHEAEIAQQEAASGQVPFVKYWMHAGFLENREQKMSKSLGNFATLHDLLRQHEPAVLRFYLLSNHYRTPLEFSEDSIQRSKAGLDNLSNVIQRMTLQFANGELVSGDSITNKLNSYWEEISKAMDADFNTAEAFGFMSGMISEIHQAMDAKRLDMGSYMRAKDILMNIDNIFGIIPSDIPQNIKDRNRLIDAARSRKDYTEADRLRDLNTKAGYMTVTGASGTISISPSASPSPAPDNSEPN